MLLVQGVVIAKSLGSPMMYISFFLCPASLMAPQPLLLLSPFALFKKPDM